MIIGQILFALLLSLFLRSIVLKCSSPIALIISVVLLLNWSIISLELLELATLLFKIGSDDVPVISLQEFV